LPDSGRRVIWRHNSWAKKNHRNKSMKALIPISPKKIGHYDGCKMDYPRNYNNMKFNPNNIKIPNIQNLNPNNKEFWAIIHINLKIKETQIKLF